MLWARITIMLLQAFNKPSSEWSFFLVVVNDLGDHNVLSNIVKYHLAQRMGEEFTEIQE